MKSFQLYLDVFLLVLLVLIHLYRPARTCDVTMSHTSIYIVGARKRPYFLTFSFLFARFGRFVSAVSFRCFGF